MDPALRGNIVFRRTASSRIDRSTNFTWSCVVRCCRNTTRHSLIARTRLFSTRSLAAVISSSDRANRFALRRISAASSASRRTNRFTAAFDRLGGYFVVRELVTDLLDLWHHVQERVEQMRIELRAPASPQRLDLSGSDQGALYGRVANSASKTSPIAQMRAASGISSRDSPSG